MNTRKMGPSTDFAQSWPQVCDSLVWTGNLAEKQIRTSGARHEYVNVER